MTVGERPDGVGRQLLPYLRLGNATRIGPKRALTGFGVGFVILLGTRGGWAQESQIVPETEEDGIGRVTGVVVERASGEPIPNAIVALEPGARSALTAADGAFVFARIDTGTYRARLEHLGYDADLGTIVVRPGAVQVLRLEVDVRAVAVEPLLVVVDRHERPMYLESVGFFQRVEQGWGRFFEPQYMESWGESVVRLDRFLERFAPVRLRRHRSRGVCTPAVYLDGRRVRVAGVERFSVSEIGAIEFYDDTHGAPVWALEASGGCGAIVLWSRRW